MLVPIAGLGECVRLSVEGENARDVESRVRAAWNMSPCLEHHAHGCTIGVELVTSHSESTDFSREADRITDSDLQRLLGRVSQAVTLALIQAQAGNHLMFHAGAVSHLVSGRSLVFVAESRTGKTTLAQVLGKSYGYLTDETAAIDQDLRILAYAKPLSVRTAGTSERRELSPNELGLLPPHASPTLGRIVYLRRRDDHVGPPKLTELGLFDAIERLVPQTSSLGRMDRGLHRLADAIERTGPVLQIDYAEAETLVPLVDVMLGEAS